MKFSYIPPTPIAPYIPPAFETFTVPATVSLVNGGSAASPNTGSIIQVLAISTAMREYYILNTGDTNVRLFSGGTAATTASLQISGMTTLSSLPQ